MVYSTAYLGITWVVSDQIPSIENIWRGTTAKHRCKEPKECHSSTKQELGYTLVPAMHAQESRTGLKFYHLFLHVFIFVCHKKMFPTNIFMLSEPTKLKLTHRVETTLKCEYLAG